MIEAAFWGLLAASALILGAEVAFRFDLGRVTVGLIMAFGVGALVSSVSFELVAPALEVPGDIALVAFGIFAGSATFFVGDRVVSGMGGEHRKDLRQAPKLDAPNVAVSVSDASVSEAPGGETAESAARSGWGIALGTALDGIPESAVLGISLAGGDSVSVALLVAVFISNLPESLGSTAGLQAADVPRHRIRRLWWAIVLVAGLSAALGYALVTGSDMRTGALLQSFAAGALLTMIVDELAPEAFHRSALYAGVAATTGFVLTLFLMDLG